VIELGQPQVPDTPRRLQCLIFLFGDGAIRVYQDDAGLRFQNCHHPLEGVSPVPIVGVGKGQESASRHTHGAVQCYVRILSLIGTQVDDVAIFLLELGHDLPLVLRRGAIYDYNFQTLRDGLAL
jgi:hypothetical protein